MQKFLLATKVGRFLGVVFFSEIAMWLIYAMILPFYKADIRIMVIAVFANILTSAILALTNRDLKTWI